MRLIHVPFLFALLSSPALADVGSDLAEAESAVQEAATSLQGLYDARTVQFTGQAENEFLRAMNKLGQARIKVASAKAATASQGRMDEIQARTDLVQKLLSAYLGRRVGMDKYLLNTGSIEVQAGAGGVVAELATRYRFLGAVGAGGVIRYNSGAQAASQFSSLQGEFFTLLTRA
ncbi:MAG TPA: hypothetical protein VM598_09415, partial [Bdellovibrionota bacterium]|nr:hypothetical protein [Bdellovibrionota bacterium]